MPHRDILNQAEPAIKYCKVEGIWENHTKTVEAELIVEKVFQILQQHPAKEIGIVTFNAPQQILVLDLLEAEAAKDGKIFHLPCL